MIPRMVTAGVLLFLVFGLPSDAMACSCGWAGPLLTVGPKTELIVRAKVLGYSQNAMDVEVLGKLKGDTKSAKIRIWGDNGMQCRPYVTQFPIGTEWIFAVHTGNRPPLASTPPGDYEISVCGEYWARVEGGNVSGRLSSPARMPFENGEKPESMSLAQFREKLRGALK